MFQYIIRRWFFINRGYVPPPIRNFDCIQRDDTYSMKYHDDDCIEYIAIRGSIFKELHRIIIGT